MIFTKRQVMEGERMPWGYGLSYYLLNQNAYIAYPVPFNRIVRWARNLYIWIASPKLNWREKYEGVSRQLSETQERLWKEKELADRWRRLCDKVGYHEQQ